jgi:hypothetical protein
MQDAAAEVDKCIERVRGSGTRHVQHSDARSLGDETDPQQKSKRETEEGGRVRYWSRATRMLEAHRAYAVGSTNARLVRGY